MCTSVHFASKCDAQQLQNSGYMSLSKDFMNGECTDKQGIEVCLSIREIMLCTFLVHKGVLAWVVCILRFCLHRKPTFKRLYGQGHSKTIQTS